MPTDAVQLEDELLGPEAPALIKRHHESTPDPNSRSQSVTELQQQVDVLEGNGVHLSLAGLDDYTAGQPDLVSTLQQCTQGVPIIMA